MTTSKISVKPDSMMTYTPLWILALVKVCHIVLNIGSVKLPVNELLLSIISQNCGFLSDHIIFMFVNGALSVHHFINCYIHHLLLTKHFSPRKYHCVTLYLIISSTQSCSLVSEVTTIDRKKNFIKLQSEQEVLGKLSGVDPWWSQTVGMTRRGEMCT